jgi:AbrB family looped-hinge helix DNA binding protein
MKMVRISSKGQITIPTKFRQKMKLAEGRAVTMRQMADGSVVVRPVVDVRTLAGSLRPTKPIPLPTKAEIAHSIGMAAGRKMERQAAEDRALQRRKRKTA